MTDVAKEPEVSPPAFGHPMRLHFGFETSYVNLNHGSYGSVPLPVSKACEKITCEIEANPDRYMRLTYIPLLNVVRARVADLIGAKTDECVLVPNATHGVNTVLRNLDWRQGDVVVGTSVTYKSVSRTIQYVSDSLPGPELARFDLIFPTTVSDILARFRAHLKNIPRQPARKIVVIIDAIISNPGVLLPWQEMVKICKEEGVISIVDAAHSIGQEVGINLKMADPDFWISNCHKWLFAKRGCAVLYVPQRNQHVIKTTLPTSAYYVSPTDPPGGPEAPNFVGQFQWTGTIDPASYLSVTHALDFRQWIGGEEKINEYCHNLALTGGKRLAELLGTRVMDENGEFTANMVNVELPLRVKESNEAIIRICESFMQRNMFAMIYYHNDILWVRCSAQIFNEISDFEKLGEALLSICKTIEEGK